MKLSKKVFISLPIFVLFILIPVTALIKTPPILAQNEVKDSRADIRTFEEVNGDL